MTSLTPRDLARLMTRAARDAARNLRAAESQTVADALAEAVRLSSGPMTAAMLRAAGHPYARRRPTSPNPQVVNVQTGRLVRSWRPVRPTLSAGTVTSAVVNSSPEAAYLVGTRRMIPRPIDEAVKKAVQPARVVRLQKAIADALTP